VTPGSPGKGSRVRPCVHAVNGNYRRCRNASSRNSAIRARRGKPHRGGIVLFFYCVTHFFGRATTYVQRFWTEGLRYRNNSWAKGLSLGRYSQRPRNTQDLNTLSQCSNLAEGDEWANVQIVELSLA
jgi:hypothetical protein